MDKKFKIKPLHIIIALVAVGAIVFFIVKTITTGPSENPYEHEAVSTVESTPIEPVEETATEVLPTISNSIFSVSAKGYTIAEPPIFPATNEASPESTIQVTSAFTVTPPDNWYTTIEKNSVNFLHSTRASVSVNYSEQDFSQDIASIETIQLELEEYAETMELQSPSYTTIFSGGKKIGILLSGVLPSETTPYLLDLGMFALGDYGFTLTSVYNRSSEESVNLLYSKLLYNGSPLTLK